MQVKLNIVSENVLLLEEIHISISFSCPFSIRFRVFKPEFPYEGFYILMCSSIRSSVRSSVRATPNLNFTHFDAVLSETSNNLYQIFD